MFGTLARFMPPVRALWFASCDARFCLTFDEHSAVPTEYGWSSSVSSSMLASELSLSELDTTPVEQCDVVSKPDVELAAESTLAFARGVGTTAAEELYGSANRKLLEVPFECSEAEFVCVSRGTCSGGVLVGNEFKVSPPAILLRDPRSPFGDNGRSSFERDLLSSTDRNSLELSHPIPPHRNH